MKLATMLAFCLCLLVAIAPAETITIEVELPENPGGIFGPSELKALQTAYADGFTKWFAREDPIRYQRACDNWKTNYDGNGVCDYLPLPPTTKIVDVEWQGTGWGVTLREEPPTLDICQLTDDWLAKLSNSCRQKLGVGPAPIPTPGAVKVLKCYRWGICQADQSDTVEHGNLVSGEHFPDGKPRYKVIGGFGGTQQWYQLTPPEGE